MGYCNHKWRYNTGTLECALCDEQLNVPDFLRWGIERVLAELTAQLAAANNQLERERMRLAACGVVAMANTPESAAKARDMHPDYRSASCDDVARMVDGEMELRAQLGAAEAERDRLRKAALSAKNAIAPHQMGGHAAFQSIALTNAFNTLCAALEGK